MAETPSEQVVVVDAIDIQELTTGVRRGAWVAISSNHERRIAVGASVEEVIRKSEDEGEPEPLIVRVPEAEATLVL